MTAVSVYKRNNCSTGVKTYEQSVEDFWQKTNRGDPESCWEWTASRSKFGYGYCCFQGKTILAHRASYLIHHGQIPAGMNVLHKCDNPPCVNPNHLFAGTDLDNVRDAISKGRHGMTRCPDRVARGVNVSSCVLNEEQVRNIRQSYLHGETQMSLAERFGVARTTVEMLVNRKTWKHIA